MSESNVVRYHGPLVRMRNRAFLAVMAYSFARVSAVVGLKMDYYPQQKRWWPRLHEQNGKVNEMPRHHKLEAYLNAHIQSAGIDKDRKEPLLPSVIGKTQTLRDRGMSSSDAWAMVRKRGKYPGIETAIGNHNFRATGITDYFSNGGPHRSSAAYGRQCQREDNRPL